MWRDVFVCALHFHYGVLRIRESSISALYIYVVDLPVSLGSRAEGEGNIGGGLEELEESGRGQEHQAMHSSVNETMTVKQPVCAVL